MEKRKPHHSRATIKKLIAEGKVCITLTALSDAQALGIDRETILKTACSLTQKTFYKSMTSYSNPHSWQDVYHPLLENGIQLYMKLTITDGVLILSCKEK